jgi:Glycosyltransferase family 87
VAFEDRDRGRRLVTASLLIAPIAIVAALVLLTSRQQVSVFGSDLETYRGYAERLLAGTTPYRGFALEYPPLALIPMAVPAVVAALFGGGPDAYATAFAAVQAIVAMLAGWLILRVSPRPIGALATWAALVVAGAVSVAWRYDLWPAVTVLAAVVAAERGRPGLAGVALGLGTAMKLFPIVALPILVVRMVAVADRPGLWRLVGGTVVALAAVAVGVAFVAGADALQPLAYQLERGLQLESVGSGLLLLGHVAGGLPVSVSHEFGSLQLTAPGAEALAAASSFVEAALVVVVTLVAAAAFRRDVRLSGSIPLERTAEATVAVLLALLVGSKVFSIQYIVWFLPLVPLLRVPQRWFALAIAAWSALVYPLGYAGLWQLDPAMIVVLDIRNALLIAFLGWIMLDLARRRASSADESVRQRRSRRSPGGAPA